MPFDFTPYGTKTTNEVLKIVENLKLKGYILLNHINSFGHSPLKENFFIFQKRSKSSKPKSEYLRLILKSKGWNSEKLFYWSVEFSFKPSNYKYNTKTENHWTSEEFKGTAEDLYLNRFFEAIEQIKLYINKIK